MCWRTAPGRYGASVHDVHRERTCRARHRHPALSVSLYGAGLKKAGRPEAGSCHRPRAVLEASRRAPELALFAGGKSFGGRMTSQAQAASPLPGLRGSCSSDSPFIRPAGLRRARKAPFSTCKSRCCSLQGTRMSSRTCRFWKPSANSLVPAPRSNCFPMPTIPFTCPPHRPQGFRSPSRIVGCIGGLAPSDNFGHRAINSAEVAKKDRHVRRRGDTEAALGSRAAEEESDQSALPELRCELSPTPPNRRDAHLPEKEFLGMDPSKKREPALAA